MAIKKFLPPRRGYASASFFLDGLGAIIIMIVIPGAMLWIGYGMGLVK